MLTPNPFGPQQDPGGLFSALHARKRLIKKMYAAKVEDKIFQIVQDVFEDALGQEMRQENVLLSRLEKKYLLAQTMKQILSDMLKRLDDSTKT